MSPAWLVLPIILLFKKKLLQYMSSFQFFINIRRGSHHGYFARPLLWFNGTETGLQNYSGQGTMAEDQAGPVCLSPPRI